MISSPMYAPTSRTGALVPGDRKIDRHGRAPPRLYRLMAMASGSRTCIGDRDRSIVVATAGRLVTYRIRYGIGLLDQLLQRLGENVDVFRPRTHTPSNRRARFFL